MQRLLPLLKCLRCSSDLELRENAFGCVSCSAQYPIIDGIPRFVPEAFYTLSTHHASIEEKTKNYFGFQWDYFKDWGYIADEDVPDERCDEYFGGTVSARRNAFDKKCRMDAEDLKTGSVVLDAGCGNGRYTYEAASRGDALVIGVDIGYGSVQSAYQNNQHHDNVIIIQASLFALPFKDDVLDSCFSNGVLMHTGNAHRAFREIARCIKPAGVFVAHVYHKLNPFWEFNDAWIRQITTRLSIEHNLHFARFMAGLAKRVDAIPNGLRNANYFFRLQKTVTHMFDWYSAPVASHHTYAELMAWYRECGFIVDVVAPQPKFFNNIWGINLKCRKAGTLSQHEALDSSEREAVLR
jgi:SAM-dependent methyltransferase